MASLLNALRYLNPELDSDLFTGFHFLPTYEEGITIVNRKNAGGEVLPILEVVDPFRHPPKKLKEGYYFSKLKPAGKNKVNRKLWDGADSPYWKNIKTTDVVVNNNIGCVTKLVLHLDKNTPTEWHILEYRDRKKPDAGRWVLCNIYKREKNNGSGCFDPYTDNRIVPDPLESDIRAGQFHPSTSQDSSMNEVQHYEMHQNSNTQPYWSSHAAATYPHPTEGHMNNQDQFLGVDDTDMGLLDDESFKQLLEEFSNIN